MKRRPDGRYQKKITIDGISKMFYSSADTERKATLDIQRQLLAYEEKLHKKKHNFLELAEAMLLEKEKTVSHSTCESYRHALKHLKSFYDMDIQDITAPMVQSCLIDMSKRKFSSSAISKTKITFGLVLNYAILNNVPVNNFMSSIKLPKSAVKNKIGSASDNDISSITKTAQTSKFGMWGLILLYTGMRRGELAALQKRDIDFKSGTIRVWRSVEYVQNNPVLKNMPKSISGVRDIPILTVLEEPLREYCKTIPNEHFLFGGDKPLTETVLKRRWKNYCNEIGIQIHQHQLRHAYAKILYRAGVDPKTAQGLLGHADIQTTMNIYTEFSNDVTVKSVNKINQFINDLNTA